MNTVNHVSEVKNEVKETFILRLANNSDFYLQDISWVGTFFRETYAGYNNWSIVSDMLNHKQPSAMNHDDVVLRFDTEKEAKDALIKIFKSYSDDHKKSIPRGLIELVSIQVSVVEKVIAQYSAKEIMEAGDDNDNLFDEFEKQFVETPFAKSVHITLEDLKGMRGTTEYNDNKIESFFRSWIELNIK